MKKIYFTCGPSQLYPTVSKHLNNALKEDILSVSHRSKKFEEIFLQTQISLRKLLSVPDNFHIFFLSSSLEAMERIIENCVEKRSFHFIDGSFSQKWKDETVAEKKKPNSYLAEWGSAFDMNNINIDRRVELICVTQNETSTGVSLGVEEINQLKNKYPDKLLAVDIVSSVPYPELNFRKVDLAFFSVQKGFGLPAGLSVLIVSPKAMEKSRYLNKSGMVKTAFHSFVSLSAYESKFQTPETPNILGIYLLGKVCQDMLKTGIGKIRKDTEIKAKMIYDFFDKHTKYQPEVKELEYRSKTTVNIKVGADKEKIMKKLVSKGLIVSSGYGDFKQSHIRVANFPAHSIINIRKLLNLIGYN